MRIVQMRNNYKGLAAKQDYIMAEDYEEALRLQAGDSVGSSIQLDLPPDALYKGQDLTDKKILTWRTGGFGDILFLTPVFAELKRRYPTCSIKLATARPEVMIGNTDCETILMPYSAKELLWANYVLQLQGVIESNAEAHNTHAVDLHLKMFGIDPSTVPPVNKIPKLVLLEKEIAWSEAEIDKLGWAGRVVGIQLTTSSPLRTMPPQLVRDVVAQLLASKIHVALIGGQREGVLAKQLLGLFPQVTDLTGYTPRQNIALTPHMACIVAGDSWMIQVGGALSVPVVGVYGPFPSDLRMRYHRDSIGLDIEAICAPCFTHSGSACVKGNPSPCMSLHSSNDITNAVKLLIGI